MVFSDRQKLIERINYILKNYDDLRSFYRERSDYYRNTLAEVSGARPCSNIEAVEAGFRAVVCDWCFAEAVWHAGEELTDPEEFRMFQWLYVMKCTWCQIQLDTGKNPKTIGRIRKRLLDSICAKVSAAGMAVFE